MTKGVSFWTLQINQSKGGNQHRTRTNDKGQQNHRERGTAKVKGDSKDQTKSNPKPRPLQALASIEWGHPPPAGSSSVRLRANWLKRARAITSLGLNIRYLGRGSKKRPNAHFVTLETTLTSSGKEPIPY